MKRYSPLRAPIITTLVALVLFGGRAVSDRSSEHIPLLSSPAAGLTLDANRGTVLIAASARGEAPRWTAGGTDAPPLWRIRWKSPDGVYLETTPRTDNERVKFIGAEPKDQVATIRWSLRLSRPDDAAVIASVETDPYGTLRWRLEARTDAEGWRPHDVDFPIIGGVQADGARLVQPHGWGLLRDGLADGPVWGNYPGVFASMQFFALQTPAGLLYMGAEDPEASRKIFGAVPDSEHNTIDLRVRHFPPSGATESAHWATPYPVAVAVVPGATWVEAARRYRDWTYSAPYGRCRLEDGLVPDWLEENDLWICHEDGATDATGVGRLLDWPQKLGVPSSVHWYRWHKIPHDVGYPEYFPPKPDSFDAFHRVQKAGLHVMPYINGRLWDPATDSWKVRNASESATRDENGNIRTEVYYTKIPLAVMCPSTELWQDVVAGLVRRLARDVNVDAVYIDQIGAADAVICYATNHPHQPGSAANWAAGYRKLLQRCRDALRPDQAITTEECADPWNDLIDGFLLVNTHTGLGDIIPLYPMVYGGRTVYFGFQYIAGSEIQEGTPLRAKLARSFAWGGQIGWVRPVIADPQHRTELEFLRELGLVRNRSHRYLQRGRMLPSPEIAGAEIVEVTACAANGFHPDRVPAVVNGLWQAEDALVGLALANWTDKAETIRVRGLRYQNAPDIIATDPLPPPQRVGRDWRIEIPARRAMVLVWKGNR